MTSKTSICNRAAQLVGDDTILDITDDNTLAIECNRAYEPVRNAALRSHPWSFSRSRAVLAKDTLAPLFEWNNSFSLPADWIRFLSLEDPLHTYEIEGRKLLTNLDAPLNIRYFKLVTDENTFDPLFVELLAHEIAYAIVEKLTQSNSKKQIIRFDRTDIIAQAKRVNAIERIPTKPVEDDWILVRR
ncbi:MAG: hypothetical protein V7745_07575 [Pseudomonadales bacterium]